MSYTKQFQNPHPQGWDNPEYRPPIDVNSMQAQTDALSGIDNYLFANTGDLINVTAVADTTITVKSHGHTYVVLTFGENLYNITFVKSDPDDPNEITYQGEAPTFEPNSTYELSFLYLNCIWKKR